MDHLLRSEGLSAGYGSGDVIRSINLAIARKDRVVLIGRNGVGKTTLVRCLVGLILASAGKLRFGTVDILPLPARKRAGLGIGYVPQGRHVFSELTVRENLLVGEEIGRSRPGRRLRYDLVYRYFPVLKERKDQRAGTLSGGEQQMLAIGRALVGDPELCVLDEPSAGIQPSLVMEITDVLRRLNEEEGLTLLLVEQNLRVISRVGTHGLVMNRGSIIAQLDQASLQDSEQVAHYLTI
jgi:branched-chain amino acid transport system ATP-binding protein